MPNQTKASLNEELLRDSIRRDKWRRRARLLALESARRAKLLEIYREAAAAQAPPVLTE